MVKDDRIVAVWQHKYFWCDSSLTWYVIGSVNICLEWLIMSFLITWGKGAILWSSNIRDFN